MKKKGFTLIELIVVIAIIGVLAALLIPAMIGYIRRSKITSMNSSAKQLMTAAASAVTDIDAEDRAGVRINLLPATISGAGNTFTATYNSGTDTENTFYHKINQYFSDVTTLDTVAFAFTNGVCTATAVMDNGYPGTNPMQYTVDDWALLAANTVTTADGLLGYAANGRFGN